MIHKNQGIGSLVATTQEAEGRWKSEPEKSAGKAESSGRARVVMREGVALL